MSVALPLKTECRAVLFMCNILFQVSACIRMECYNIITHTLGTKSFFMIPCSYNFISQN